MSYILDALQRADAERERGHVPGIHSQMAPSAVRTTASVRRWKPAHTAAALAVLVLIAAAIGWWWSARDGAEPIAASAPTPAPATAPASPTPTAPALADAAPPAPPVASASEPVQPILAPPRVEAPKPRPPTAAAARPAQPPPEATPSAPATSAAPAAPPAPVQPATPAASATPNKDAAGVRSFAELSPEARAQLPPVNVSGSTYSRNPALRMLIVNGKVLQEGQEIAPGFKLETIGPRNAVLNHQGMRYSIGY